MPLGADIAAEIGAGIDAGDLARRRVEGRGNTQWIEIAQELRRRLLAVRHESRANHEGIGAGGGSARR